MRLSRVRRCRGARWLHNGGTRSIGIVLCVLLLGACTEQTRHGDDLGKPGGTARVVDTPATGQAPVLPPGIYPASQQLLPTTAGALYLANVNARIEVMAGRAARKDADSASISAYAGLLYHRFQILGRIEDAERALALADAIKNPSAADLRVRASLRSGLHRFDEALADLNRAEALDAQQDDSDARRAIALATGDYARIRQLIDAAGQPAPKFGELVLRGNIAVFKNDLAAANAQFLRAQQTINDTEPYPLAWLYAQQGLTLQRFDRCEEALPFLDAALERLPGYALALDHQGECLLRLHRLDEARDVYRQLIGQTGNPEYLGGMSLVEKQAGNNELAQQFQDKAVQAYDALLAHAPKAWSEHAADYYLAAGRNAEALRLARINLANRRDVLSLILLARAANANGDTAGACKALSEVGASGLRPPELEYWKKEFPRCDGGSSAGT